MEILLRTKVVLPVVAWVLAALPLCGQGLTLPPVRCGSDSVDHQLANPARSPERARAYVTGRLLLSDKAKLFRERSQQEGILPFINQAFIIPVVVVTFLLQNQLLRGVTFGTIRK